MNPATRRYDAPREARHGLRADPHRDGFATRFRVQYVQTAPGGHCIETGGSDSRVVCSLKLRCSTILVMYLPSTVQSMSAPAGPKGERN